MAEIEQGGGLKNKLFETGVKGAILVVKILNPNFNAETIKQLADRNTYPALVQMFLFGDENKKTLYKEAMNKQISTAAGKFISDTSSENLSHLQILELAQSQLRILDTTSDHTKTVEKASHDDFKAKYLKLVIEKLKTPK